LNKYEDTLRSVLKELYKLVGLLVIKRLNELNIPEQSQIWWCPTLVFCSLPLHAMGPIPSDMGHPQYFLDLYIPSYTPSLSALIVLPPEQVAELLLWYMQWSRDLAAEMHQRRLIGNKAHRTSTLPSSYRPCDCASDWRCEPHNTCFIHESCFCPGSSSFPPVKPPRS